jgi:hypothetical protein
MLFIRCACFHGNRALPEHFEETQPAALKLVGASACFVPDPLPAKHSNSSADYSVRKEFGFRQTDQEAHEVSSMS